MITNPDVLISEQESSLINILNPTSTLRIASFCIMGENDIPARGIMVEYGTPQPSSSNIMDYLMALRLPSIL